MCVLSTAGEAGPHLAMVPSASTSGRSGERGKQMYPTFTAVDVNREYIIMIAVVFVVLNWFLKRNARAKKKDISLSSLLFYIYIYCILISNVLHRPRWRTNPYRTMAEVADEPRKMFSS
eukprot:gene5695-4060_t